MRVAVIGSRNFSDKDLLFKTLNEIKSSITEIVSGGAKGADSLAESWACDNNIPVKIFKPDWNKYGRSAGIERNREIIKYCDRCIAFWDGNSKGTESTIKICQSARKPIRVVRY